MSRIPWRRIFRHIGKEYGWSAREVSSFTLAQVYVYYLELDDVGAAQAAGSPAEVVAVSVKAAKQKSEWVQRMRESLRWVET